MNKRFLTLVGALFCVVLLVGCNEEAKLKKATPKEADALAREFISALNAKNSDKAIQLIEPSIRSEAKPKLKPLLELLSKEKIEQVKILGVRGQKKEDQKLIQIHYQIYFEKAWIVAALAILETPKDRHIFSVRMDPLDQPLEKMYAFKFFGKSAAHYLMFLFAVLIPVFILYTLMHCLKMPGHKKWIWAPFILIGVVSFHLDWTSGRTALQPISALIFGVAFMKQKYGPLILSLSLPVGALIFFFKYLFRKSRAV